MIRPVPFVAYLLVLLAATAVGMSASGAQEPVDVELVDAIVEAAEPGTEGPVEAPAGAVPRSGLPVPDAAADEVAPAAEAAATVVGANTTSQSAVVVAGALALGGIIAAVWMVQRRREAEVPAEQETTDSATGLFSRRRLDNDIDRRGEAGDGRVTCLMIDVDHFARFDDDHGVGVGDNVLRQVADMIGEQIREGDAAYRYAGEEFCVLLSDTTDDEAFAVAERLRTHAITLELPVDATVTVSLGLASGGGDEVSDVLRNADAALAVAKSDGRNRTVIG